MFDRPWPWPGWSGRGHRRRCRLRVAGSCWGWVPSGKRALTLDLVATSRKSGNWQVFAEWFSLTGPDGVAVPADGAEQGSLPGNDDGLVTDGLYLRFLVDEDASGPHTLTLVPADYWIESGPAEASVELALG